MHFLAANFVFSLSFLLVDSVLSCSNEQREKKRGCSEESHVKEALMRICEGGRAFLLSLSVSSSSQSLIGWTGSDPWAQRDVFFPAPPMPGCDCAHPALCPGTSFPGVSGKHPSLLALPCPPHLKE